MKKKKEKKNYIIVEAKNSEQLQKKVNELILEGRYVPTGGVSVAPYTWDSNYKKVFSWHYSQAMIDTSVI